MVPIFRINRCSSYISKICRILRHKIHLKVEIKICVSFVRVVIVWSRVHSKHLLILEEKPFIWKALPILISNYRWCISYLFRSGIYAIKLFFSVMELFIISHISIKINYVQMCSVRFCAHNSCTKSRLLTHRFLIAYNECNDYTRGKHSSNCYNLLRQLCV